MQNTMTENPDPSPLSADATFSERIARLGEHDALRILSFVIRVFLAYTFLISGAEKLVAMRTFGHNIAAYGILPDALSNIAAALFVWSEIIIGVFLFAGVLVRGSGLVSSALLLLFLIAIISALARGLEIDCGCFANPEPIGLHKVWEDLALLAGATYLILFPKSYLMWAQLVHTPDRSR